MKNPYAEALADAEAEALKNNYLGERLDVDEVEEEKKYSETAAAAIAERARRTADILALPSETDFRSLLLKEWHESRPLWVAPNGSVYLETHSPHFRLATDFLVAVAEPESRPELIHHYKLTPYSLYAAVSVNLDTETILRTLEKLSKVVVPPQVVAFIKHCTASHGKAKLVLKRNRLFVESPYAEVLKKLLDIREIRKAKDESLDAKLHSFDVDGSLTTTNNSNKGSKRRKNGDLNFIESQVAAESIAAQATNFDELERLFERRLENVDEIGDEDDEEEVEEQKNSRQSTENLSLGKRVKSEGEEKSAAKTVLSFEIKPEFIEEVKEAAMKADLPLMEEYDFRRDSRNPNLPDFNPRPSTKIRDYQEKSLAKMFGNGRARSGIIVLPCGAGKTLTGIVAAYTIGKSCIIFCYNAVGVEQWIRSLLMFTTIKPEYIRRFTAHNKDDLHESGATILVTTYTMMSYRGSRSDAGDRVMEQVKQTEWGLIIMDEVHVVPAFVFRMALRHVKSHCKLGLTATLVREDDKIVDLNFLVGPKLFEANWLELTNDGYLAKVLCAEVWCPMTKEFFQEYLDPNTDPKRKKLLYVMNPNKFDVCRMLLRYHREKNDKILIFSDHIPAVLRYSKYLKVHNLYGSTTQWERERLLRRFRGGIHMEKGETEINVLLISSVGDVGIDLPQANVIIQISSHFASRRQEAQRLGRILRPKAGEDFNVGWNAFFYTLISQDTAEMFYSNKRQKYLVDQGYTFKVIRDIKKIARESGIPYEELSLEVQRVIQRDLGAEEIKDVMENLNKQKEEMHRKRKGNGVAKRGGGAAATSGREPKNKFMRKALNKGLLG